MGGDNTHEFLVLAETGESEVFYDNSVIALTFGDRELITIMWNNAPVCWMNLQTCMHGRRNS